LEALFSQFGTVQSAQVIVDRDTNRSKGFGFVEMSTDAEAQAAIEGLNGRNHDGRDLTGNEAKPREPRTGAGGYDPRGRGGGGGGVAGVTGAVVVGAIDFALPWWKSRASRARPFDFPSILSRALRGDSRLTRPPAPTGRFSTS